MCEKIPNSIGFLPSWERNQYRRFAGPNYHSENRLVKRFFEWYEGTRATDSTRRGTPGAHQRLSPAHPRGGRAGLRGPWLRRGQGPGDLAARRAVDGHDLRHLSEQARPAPGDPRAARTGAARPGADRRRPPPATARGPACADRGVRRLLPRPSCLPPHAPARRHLVGDEPPARHGRADREVAGDPRAPGRRLPARHRGWCLREGGPRLPRAHVHRHGPGAALGLGLLGNEGETTGARSTARARRGPALARPGFGARAPELTGGRPTR